MTETKLTWHHPLCEGECFACLIERTIKKEYGEVGLRYLLKQINDAPVQQAEQELVAWALTSENGEVLDCISHTYKVTQPCTVDYDEPLYAAPVRTKDLTEPLIDELRECRDLLMCVESCSRNNFENLAYERVQAIDEVIAADRRKNK